MKPFPPFFFPPFLLVQMIVRAVFPLGLLPVRQWNWPGLFVFSASQTFTPSVCAHYTKPVPEIQEPFGGPEDIFSVKRDSAARSSRAAEKRFFAIPVSQTAGIRDAEIVENVID